MNHIEYTSPWKKFVMLHETTCSGCPSHGMGDSSGNIWTTYNTTYNIDNGCGSGFWGGFKSGIGGILGGMLGGLLSGWLGNIGTCFWGGGGGSCGCNINQLLDPNLAIQQAMQGMQSSFGNFWSGAGNWFNPANNNTVTGTTSDTTTKGSSKSKDKKTTDDNGTQKSVDDLKKDVEELLAKETPTKEELQLMYDKLSRAKDNDNSSELEELQKKISDKASENNIELNTEDNVQNNNKQTTSENNSSKNNTTATRESSSVDGTSQQASKGSVTGNQSVDETSKSSQTTGTTDAAQGTESTEEAITTAESSIDELKKLGLNDNNAAKLARIGVKPSAAGSKSVTLPNVLSKANLLALKDAVFGTGIHVAAAHNPNSKGDQWIIGTIGDINGDDNNLEFSIDCVSAQPPNTLGFKYKVAKQDDGYKIDLYDEASEKQAKAVEYGHKARKYTFSNGQLVYADAPGGTVVSKTYKN